MRFGLFAPASLAALLLSSPVQAGKANDTLTWTTSSEVETADIYYGNSREALITAYSQCDTLIHRDPISQEYKPLLATSWKWIEPTVLELELRKGVKFHNGADFTANDVAYTLNHVAAPDSNMVLRVLVDWIKNVEVVAPYRVRIHTNAPTPAAFEYLSGTTPIYPAGHYEKAPEVPAAGGKVRKDWGAVQPVCTGPYKLTQFRAGQTLTLEKNAAYFDGSPKGKPSIGKIVFRTIKDPETQVAELVSGGVDWVWGVPKENAAPLAAMGNLKVSAAPTMRISFLMVDSAGRSGDSPLKDVRVRQAMAHAIDRQAIAKDLVGDSSIVQEAMCVPLQFGCDTKVKQYEYNPARAKDLLREAGYPNGLKLDFYAYRDRPFSEAVTNYLRAVGIETNIQFLTWRALRPLVQSGKAGLTHMTYGSNGILDASASAGYYFNGDVEDYARDAELTATLKQAEGTVDETQRKHLYTRALSRIADQAYAIPLFIYGRTYAFNRQLDYPVTSDELAHFYLGKWN
ncbi:ABC transporter substrate-binding protein [Bosea beijingensis]|uniref:ABC transporter substrate-binding protein n=1 Tax=Bosea beijingensis TaxID=3068632 RepID=UPI00274182A1|nr:ABC transporter substrate-binding protein [Bosea sp. REN20]